MSDFKDMFSSFNDIEILNDNSQKIIKVLSTISKDNLLGLLDKIFEYEKDEDNNVILRLKGLSIEYIADVLKYSMKQESIKNPSIIMNLISLVKVFNTLDESFFESDDIFVSSPVEMLQLKRLLKDELVEFKKQISIYFVSLLKSFNKLSYTPSDNVMEMPSLYKIIFASSDMMTISGILSTSETFNTNECVYILEAVGILTPLILNTQVGSIMTRNFLSRLCGESNDNTTR